MSPRTRTVRAAVALALLALALPACKKAPPKPKGIGKPLAQAPMRDLQLSPDSKAFAYIAEPVKPPEPGAPENVQQGVLSTIPVDGGPVRPLGGGVTTFEDAFRISPDGAFIAYLQGFRFRERSGNLNLAPMPSGDPMGVAEGATYYKFSPDSRSLAFIAAGELRLLELASKSERTVAKQAATFEFSKDGKQMLIRQPASAGGALLLAPVEGEGAPRKLGERVGEYDFSPDGKLVAFTSRVNGPNEPLVLFVGPVSGNGMQRIGEEGVSTFLFSPDSHWISFVDGVSRYKTLGNLQLAATAGGQAKKIGEDLVEQRWSPNSQALGFRESHQDKSGKSWNTFKVATVPGGNLRVNETAVINFVFSADGTRVAYLKGVTKPQYSVDLFLTELAGDKPARALDKWVYAYQFSPGDRSIWYRANCVRGGRDCELMATDLAQEGVPPRKLAQGIANFKPSADGERLLLMFPRTDTEAAYDLGWLDLAKRTASKGIDVYTLPGAVFLDPKGERVGYLVGERKREGVYVAELKSAANLPAAGAGVP